MDRFGVARGESLEKPLFSDLFFKMVSLPVYAVFSWADEDHAEEEDAQLDGVRGFAKASGKGLLVRKLVGRRDGHDDAEEEARGAKKEPVSVSIAMKPQNFGGGQPMPQSCICWPRNSHFFSTSPMKSFGTP
jgi:hypothetical protein